MGAFWGLFDDLRFWVRIRGIESQLEKLGKCERILTAEIAEDAEGRLEI